MNLWIDGEIISVKHSTLCVCKDSNLAKYFNDSDWVLKKHTMTTEDRSKVVLMGHSCMFLPFINHLRLRCMMVDADEC